MAEPEKEMFDLSSSSSPLICLGAPLYSITFHFLGCCEVLNVEFH